VRQVASLVTSPFDKRESSADSVNGKIASRGCAMCVLEVGSIAEWVGSLAAVATAIIAGFALYAWRNQIRGTSKHKAAVEIAEAAELTKYHFYDARNFFFGAWEFPAAYHAATMRTSHLEAEGFAYVFQNRYSTLSPHILHLATLRAKAGASLSEDCAKSLEELARKAGELNDWFRQRVEQLRAGENIVSQWPDQSWVKRVKESFEVCPGRSDPYSREFEAKFDALKKSVAKFI